MLYFVFTIDGDWKEYFELKLKDEERLPKEGVLLDLVQREIDLADKVLKGRFIHFIHTSPLARDFFLEKNFRKLWKDVLKNNGDAGLHCHEDYYYQDASRMKKTISAGVSLFKKSGLDVKCYRGGFLGFSKDMVRILEGNKIHFDFSCEPGRFLKHEDTLIADWRGAPEHQYRMSYDNHCQSGDSKVWEIPLGTSQGKSLYFEKSSIEDIEKIALDLKEQSIENKIDIVASVLSHTYEFESVERIKNIEKNLTALKKYGTFINLKELEKYLWKNGRGSFPTP
ncbi:MAG: hypothetical protein KKD11_04435 [Candidatus Omnitrophica bacterium]|nr:hypothetical protein [Candidatus Omnitrophota bacterium]